MVDQTRRDALDQDLRGLPPAPGLWGLAVTLALIGERQDWRNWR